MQKTCKRNKIPSTHLLEGFTVNGTKTQQPVTSRGLHAGIQQAISKKDKQNSLPTLMMQGNIGLITSVDKATAKKVTNLLKL